MYSIEDEEINCSHVSRSQSIVQKENSLREEVKIDNVDSDLTTICDIWEVAEETEDKSSEDSEEEEFDDAVREEMKRVEKERKIDELKAKVEETIERTKQYLVGRGILAESNDVSAGKVSSVGMNFLKDDLVARVGSEEFQEKIPGYMEKFVNYISFISHLNADQQKSFLSQFPPDVEEEYQCNGGAQSRLEAVFSAAKGSSIIVRSHDVVMEDAGIKLRRTVRDTDYHPHVESFAGYLVGVDKQLIEKNDGMYLSPNTLILTRQVYKLIQNYDQDLSRSYLNLIQGNKGDPLDKIITITNADNAKDSENPYRGGDVKNLLMKGLDIEETVADDILMSISQAGEVKDENGNVRDIYWREDVEGKEGVREVLSKRIDRIIEQKTNYFERVAKEKDANALAVDRMNLENVNDLIKSTKTILDSPGKEVLADTEESGIYALRSLSERLEDDDPMHFLVASDHLVGSEKLMLEKVKNEPVLTNYVNRIFEVRDLYLGPSNSGKKVEDTHPLFYAVLTKEEEKVREIIESDQGSELLKDRFSASNQPDRISPSLERYAMMVNDFNMVKIMFDKFMLDNSQSDIVGGSARESTFIDYYRVSLREAVENDKIETVRAILATENLAIINGKDRYAETAFKWAAKNGKVKAVEAFLETGNLKIINEGPSCGTAFSYAIGEDQVETVKAFLRTKNLEIINAQSRNKIPFYCAAGSSLEVLDAFLETGNSDILDATDRNGKTFLHEAVSEKIEDRVRRVLEVRPEILNIRDIHGETALHYAVRERHFGANIETFRTLLEFSNSEVMNAKTSIGSTAFKHAMWRNMDEKVKLFLEKGAIIGNIDYSPSYMSVETKELVIGTNNNAKSLTHRIEKEGVEVLNQFIGDKTPEELKLCINISTYFNATKTKHRTPLQRAAELGNVEAMEILIEKGADADVQNSKGRVAMDYAVRAGKQESAQFLTQNYLERSVPNPSVEAPQGEEGLRESVETRSV